MALASSSLGASGLSLPGALSPWRPPRVKALHCEVRSARRSAKGRSTPGTQTTKLFLLLLSADSVVHPPDTCLRGSTWGPNRCPDSIGTKQAQPQPPICRKGLSPPFYTGRPSDLETPLSFQQHISRFPDRKAHVVGDLQGHFQLQRSRPCWSPSQ